MVLLVLHGEAGGWDELIIAVVALAVLWVAVKIAGRKSVAEDDEAETAGSGGESTSAEGTSTPASTSDSVSAPLGKRG